MLSFNVNRRILRILDMDSECRPLSWYGGDWVSKEVTAIAGRFIGEKKFYTFFLGELTMVEVLEGFREVYDWADYVTGHYIRGFDLSLINGAMLDAGLRPLGDKYAQDTKLDLIRYSGLSKSQENLSAMLGLEHPKIGMNQELWRQANRLTKKGIKLTKERVVGDVEQHIEMRQALLDRGMLGPPKLWESLSSGKNPGYHP